MRFVVFKIPTANSKNRLYTNAIIPVGDDDLTITPSLAAKIKKARKEYKEGKKLLEMQEKMKNNHLFCCK